MFTHLLFASSFFLHIPKVNPWRSVQPLFLKSAVWQWYISNLWYYSTPPHVLLYYFFLLTQCHLRQKSHAVEQISVFFDDSVYMLVPFFLADGKGFEDTVVFWLDKEMLGCPWLGLETFWSPGGWLGTYSTLMCNSWSDHLSCWRTFWWWRISLFQ